MGLRSSRSDTHFQMNDHSDTANTGPARARWRTPPRRLGWRSFAYFIGVPLLVAVYAGVNNWEMQNIAGFQAGILFYLAHSLLPWWITCISTTVFKKLLANWKPPWLALLVLGHTLGCLIVLPYSNWLTGIYAERWPLLALGNEVGPVFSIAFWKYWLQAGVVWIAVKYVFDHFIGLPLYRYVIPRGYEQRKNIAPEEPPQNGWGGRQPGFIDRLPAALLPAEVLAIKAEQHYIRVYSPTKEYMVLYRFSDALRELDDALGKQVHRSYWVNTQAISSIHAKAKDFSVRISTGVDIPVSTPYQGLMRELTRTERLQERG